MVQSQFQCLKVLNRFIRENADLGIEYILEKTFGLVLFECYLWK